METINVVNEDIYRVIIDTVYAGNPDKEGYTVKIKKMVERFISFIKEEIENKKKEYNDDVKIIFHSYANNENKTFQINQYRIFEEAEFVDEIWGYLLKNEMSPTYGREIIRFRRSLLVNSNTNDLTILNEFLPSAFIWEVIKIVPNKILNGKNIPKTGNYFDIMPIYSRLGENIKYRENDYI